MKLTEEECRTLAQECVELVRTGVCEVLDDNKPLPDRVRRDVATWLIELDQCIAWIVNH